MAKTLITAMDQRTDALSVGGLLITVLASTADTGNYEIFHVLGEENKGPGPHYHPWDESIYINRGDVYCGVGDDETVAAPGAFVHIPAGTVHWFRFGKGGGELVTMTSDGNASEMFKAFSQGINWESPDREELVKLAARYEQVIVD